MTEVRIERFNAARHQRAGFTCGKPVLDEFLRALVSQYERRRLGMTFVALNADGCENVIGYYTLAASAIGFANMPPEFARKLPRQAVPAVLLARMAVDQHEQGKGIGEMLLHDALQRTLGICNSVGVFAVEVLAIDEDVTAFYTRFGFSPLLDDPRHMFLPIKTIAEANASR